MKTINSFTKKTLSIFQAILVVFAFTLSFSSCKDDEDPEPAEEPGTVNIQFEHVWDGPNAPFSLNELFVHPKTQDSLTFTTLKYYVSNIVLNAEDGSSWSEPESYHLVDLSLADGNVLALSNVPAGNYTSIDFTFGVDSIRNVSGAQSGALAPSNNMFWDWNNGYIMLKAEGTSPQSPSGSFAFHFGGFMEPYNTVTPRDFSFNGAQIQVSSQAAPVLHMMAKVGRLWHSSASVEDKNMVHMPGAVAQTMATDFFTGVSFSHIHN